MNDASRPIIKVALYGVNGHQVTQQALAHPGAHLAAVAAFPSDRVPEGVPCLDSLDALLARPDIDLVSLCSPRRADQAAQAIACLEAGKHVYAEKPCALRTAELEAIIAAARRTGRVFHEMAGTLVDQPYATVHNLITRGAIGEIIQIYAQKCYPWHDRRPADEAIDGGLATQAGIYITRFVEHICGRRITSIASRETRTGNPDPASQCRRAVSFLMTLDNGGVASGVCNYCNPNPNLVWGYEMLRVFGTAGIVETDPQAQTIRLREPDVEPRIMPYHTARRDYFDLFIDELRGVCDAPLTLEAELSPTRWVLAAREVSV